MKLLISHCNTEKADLFGLSYHDLTEGGSYWVDVRDAALDPDNDKGITGICRGSGHIYLGVQSVTGGKVLVLDSNLNYQKTLYLQYAEDVHSLALHNNSLYITSTRSNAIVRFDLENGRESIFWQQESYIHLNDVKFYRGECYMLSQNSPGEGKNTGGTVTRLGDNTPILTGLDQPHSLWFENEQLTVLSSRKGDIKRLNMETLAVEQVQHLPGYARGIWCEGDTLYVAVSAERIHSRKRGPDQAFVEDFDNYLGSPLYESSLYTLQHNGEVLESMPLTTLNFEVYDLMALPQRPAEKRLMPNPAVVKAQYSRQHQYEEILALRQARAQTQPHLEDSAPAPQFSVGLPQYIQHWQRLRQYADQKDSFVRGAWYFSDGWPVNFWSHVEANKARSELAAIKAMDFNSVFIVIPWRGFQPDPAEGGYCANHMQRAHALLQVCDKLKLRVYARVSYGHAMCEQSNDSGQDRVERLLTNENIVKGWLEYLSALNGLTEHESLSAFFLCWEDFWHTFTDFQKRGPTERKGLAACTGYHQYVRDHGGLDSYNAAGFGNEQQYDEISSIELPLPDSARATVYLRFMNHRIRQLFEQARDHISPLTMEIRVDKDVARDRDHKSDWFENDNYADLHLPTMSYWAPFVGAKNKGETLSVIEAVSNFEYQLRRYPRTEHSPLPVINQFNFVDTTPEFAGIHAHIDSEQVVPFLQEAGIRLLHYSSGYAIWALRNYYQNLLYNASFALGSEGWEATPGQACQFRQLKRRAAVHIAPQATLAQTFLPGQRGMVWIHKADKLNLRIDFPDASKNKEKHLQVRLLGHEAVKITTTETSATVKIKLLQKHGAREPLTLELINEGGACVIQRVCLYHYEFESHILDSRARPTEYAQAISALNGQIKASRQQGFASEVFFSDQHVENGAER